MKTVKLENFKYMTADGVEKFLTYVACDGTIGMTFDMDSDYALELLTGSADIEQALPGNDEEHCDRYEEYEMLLHMLRLAVVVGPAESIYACNDCKYVSTQSVCTCGKGYGIHGIEL